MLKIVKPSEKRKQKVKSTAQYRSEGLEYLGVTSDQVAAVPKISHIFGEIDPWPYLAGSDKPEARRLLEAHAHAKLTKRHMAATPFEAFCIAAGVKTHDAFGLLSAEVADQSQKAKAMLLRAQGESVLKYTIEQAKTPAGVAERKMVLQADGVMPIPKTSVINLNGGHNVLGQQMNVQVALPPVEDLVKRASDRFNEMVVATVQALPEPEELLD